MIEYIEREVTANNLAYATIAVRWFKDPNSGLKNYVRSTMKDPEDGAEYVLTFQKVGGTPAP